MGVTGHNDGVGLFRAEHELVVVRVRGDEVDGVDVRDERSVTRDRREDLFVLETGTFRRKPSTGPEVLVED